MILSFLLSFCRLTIGLMFAWSFVGKLRDFKSFEKTIARFRLLPAWLHRPAAIAFLGSELLATVMMLLGGSLLTGGFLLAALLLTAFSIALASVVIRKINLSCNCFGPSEKLVTPYDIFRNIGFLICALGGWSAALLSQKGSVSLGILEWGLALVVAVIFVTVWTQIREIVQLFR
jgi:hypothetical protein